MVDDKNKPPFPEEVSSVDISITEIAPDDSGSGDDSGEKIPIDLARTLPTTPGTSRDPMLGSTLAGRYKVIELIGTGGMGAVYRGVHLLMQKVVAIKVLNANMLEHPEARARFEREAKAAARIGHPNVAAATDFGPTDDDGFFLVMEYVEGESLEKILRREAPLEPRRVLSIADQVCQALARAHELGIIHRDLKPENILLVDDKGREMVKILDFGIAKLTDEGSHDEPDLTKVGAIYGTPRYMAPEQIVSPDVDHRVDLYALGIIMYRMMAGRLPFDSKVSAEILEMHISADPTSPRAIAPEAEIPVRLNRAVMKLLEKKPEKRFPSASALREEIEEIAEDLKDRSYHPGFLESIGRRLEAKPSWIRMPVVMLLIATGICGVLYGLVEAGLWNINSRPDPSASTINADQKKRKKNYTEEERVQRRESLLKEIAAFE